MQNASDSKLLHADLTDKIICVYYDVYNEIGHGFLESVYSNCMMVALKSEGLTVQREVPIPVFFRGVDVGQFKADFDIEGCVLLELISVHSLGRSQEARAAACY